MNNKNIIKELIPACSLELETVQNYIAGSDIEIVGGEEDHRREFVGLLKEHLER